MDEVELDFVIIIAGYCGISTGLQDILVKVRVGSATVYCHTPCVLVVQCIRLGLIILQVNVIVIQVLKITHINDGVS